MTSSAEERSRKSWVDVPASSADSLFSWTPLVNDAPANLSTSVWYFFWLSDAWTACCFAALTSPVALSSSPCFFFRSS